MEQSQKEIPRITPSQGSREPRKEKPPTAPQQDSGQYDDWRDDGNPFPMHV